MTTETEATETEATETEATETEATETETQATDSAPTESASESFGTEDLVTASETPTDADDVASSAGLFGGDLTDIIQSGSVQRVPDVYYQLVEFLIAGYRTDVSVDGDIVTIEIDTSNARDQLDQLTDDSTATEATPEDTATEDTSTEDTATEDTATEDTSTEDTATEGDDTPSVSPTDADELGDDDRTATEGDG